MLQQRLKGIRFQVRESVESMRMLAGRHETLLLRGGIAAAVLLVCATLIAPSVLGSSRIPLVLLALYYGVIGAFILLRWHGLGFPALIVAGMLIPFAISTGTQTRINTAILLVVIMLGLWLLDMIAHQRRIAIVPARPLLPLILFMLGTLISFGFGQLPWYPTTGASLASQIGGLAIYLLLPAATLLAAHRLTPYWLRWTVGLFLALGGIYIVGSLLPQPLREITNHTYQRAVRDSLFWLWFAALALGQALFNRKLPMPLRGLLALGVALAIFITLIQKQTWTSGWLPLLAAIGVILLLTHPRLAIAGAVGVGILLLARSQFASELVLGGDNVYSLNTRLEAWKILFQIIGKSPIFGLGLANYYFYTPFYSILGYNVSFNSHNNYIDLLAQVGVVGFGLFWWFAAAMARVLWRLRTVAPAGSFEQGFIYAVCGGLIGTLVAGMFGDWVLPFVYNISMEGFRASMLAWIFFGAALMLEHHWKLHAAGADA